jgi:cell division protein FtsB
MRWLLAILTSLLIILQYRLWFGEGSLAHKSELARAIEKQQVRNERLVERNRILAEEVEGLRTDPDAVEERARADLGMIKQDETFFLVLDKKQRPKVAKPPPEEPEPEARDVVPEELFFE